MGLGGLRVGRVTVPLVDARRWVTAYLDRAVNLTGSRPYAFPAYDEFRAGSSPDGLDDGELLAPGLLNVPVKIRPFYALQRIRPQLEVGLAAIPVDLRLADADEAQARTLTEAIYAVLDERPRPSGVQATLLSKVMHRKRPEFLILHDKWVRRCYVGSGAPVPQDRTRSWAEYMSAVTLAVRADLRDQAMGWRELATVASQGQVSTVRLLDIVCWNAGQREQ